MDRVVSLTTIADQTFSIVARNPGQTMYLDGAVADQSTRPEQVLRVSGTGEIGLGTGWWDNAMLSDSPDVRYFDGDTRDTTVTFTNRVERSLDGGETWVTVAEDVQTNGSVSDWTVPLNTTALYRAVAISELGVEAPGDPVEISTPSLDVIVRYGDDFSQQFRMVCELEVPGTQESISVQHRLAGRRRPVSVYNLDHDPALTLQASGELGGKRLLVKVEQELAALQREDVWWRDHEGRAFMARISEVSTSTFFGWPRIQFSAYEVDGEPWTSS